MCRVPAGRRALTCVPVQERELLARHLDALREQMRLVRNQHSDMKMSMKEGSTKDDAMMGGMMKEGGTMGSPMMMHKKMEQRMEMLERLLQQMIEREAVQVSLEQP